MMTDTEIDALEQVAKAATKHGNCPSNAFQNAMIDCLTVEPATILELIAEVRQAKAERDWLARTFGNLPDRECPPNRRRWSMECHKVTCEDCWLEAAKEAVSCQK